MEFVKKMLSVFANFFICSDAIGAWNLKLRIIVDVFPSVRAYANSLTTLLVAWVSSLSCTRAVTGVIWCYLHGQSFAVSRTRQTLSELVRLINRNQNEMRHRNISIQFSGVVCRTAQHMLAQSLERIFYLFSRLLPLSLDVIGLIEIIAQTIA